MKITVYCDRNGILRYNPEGWPKEPSKPGEWAHQEFFTEYYEDKAKWRKDIEKAKSESVPFENQKITDIKPDSFYDVEIDGVIEIHSLGCDCELERAKGTVCLCFMCIPFQQRKQLAFIVKNEISGNSEQLP